MLRSRSLWGHYLEDEWRDTRRLRLMRSVLVAVALSVLTNPLIPCDGAASTRGQSMAMPCDGLPVIARSIPSATRRRRGRPDAVTMPLDDPLKTITDPVLAALADHRASVNDPEGEIQRGVRKRDANGRKHAGRAIRRVGWDAMYQHLALRRLHFGHVGVEGKRWCCKCLSPGSSCRCKAPSTLLDDWLHVQLARARSGRLSKERRMLLLFAG